VRAPYANRTRLSGLKDPGPHQRSNGACTSQALGPSTET